MGIRQFLKNLWDDERGQSTTEYILILSVVVMVALKFKDAFRTQMETAVQKLGTNINSAIEMQ